MKKIFLVTSTLLSTFILLAQDFNVPSEILDKIKTEQLVSLHHKDDTLTFKIVYPKNYNPQKKYRILLGLSGGNQTSEIVDYCYAAWFKSEYFANYLTILPVNTKHQSLKDCTKDEIIEIYKTLKNKFKIKKKWIIAGTSNGGVSTFKFIAADPTLFEGAIVMPGVLSDKIEITDSWKHLKIVLAYGEKDDSPWILGSQKTKMQLDTKVKKCITFEMKGQEHILPIGFDLDSVYSLYFN